MLTQKATRATIKLGNIELDVFQMPDGDYQISQSHTTEAVNKPPKRMVQLAESEKGQILIQSGFEKGLKVAVEGSKPVNLVTLDTAFQFWVLELSLGNQSALSLVIACGIEALERRADNAFGIQRSEQERNNRLEARIDHADGWRKNFTDWQKLDGCESGLDYALRVKQLKAFGGLPVDISIKDYGSKQVKKMTNCEVIYDAMRRKGLTHDEALRSL